ncbi:MAG: hypothetical protein KDC43_20245, partial [Saprospiraceae bacterium]|nr:hypothetical protein [Saprospiraceae bacterium]
ARFSFAHGGKDGHPFPVPTKVYDETIEVLRKAVDQAKIGHGDRQQAIKNLHQTAVRIEQHFTPNDEMEALIEREWAESRQYGGRTVAGLVGASDPGPRRPPKKQLSLF